MTRLVELTDIRKVYDGGAKHPALNGVSLGVERGEFLAIMGPSGSGKSTLLNLVAGLDRPTSGKVRVDGRDLGRAGEAELARYRRSGVGFVFQFFNLLGSMTVLENVMVAAQLAGRSSTVARQRARELLAQLGIADQAARYPARLSGGQQQRVAIARALVNRPLMLLADEPTGALDSRSGEQVMELLVDLNRGGQTVLLVTHDAKLAARYAGRVVSLVDGRVADDVVLQPSAASPAEVLRVRVEEVTG
ncbi:MAG TPA: ABC transporter ATP-binding protein [Candidatus Nitrosopolaris sp.]|nr:ABC transporter ATP-binding protein [Candidatus Nitrosopolaris sp.]